MNAEWDQPQIGLFFSFCVSLDLAFRGETWLWFLKGIQAIYFPSAAGGQGHNTYHILQKALIFLKARIKLSLSRVLDFFCLWDCEMA